MPTLITGHGQPSLAWETSLLDLQSQVCVDTSLIPSMQVDRATARFMQLADRMSLEPKTECGAGFRSFNLSRKKSMSIC